MIIYFYANKNYINSFSEIKLLVSNKTFKILLIFINATSAI